MAIARVQRQKAGLQARLVAPQRLHESRIGQRLSEGQGLVLTTVPPLRGVSRAKACTSAGLLPQPVRAPQVAVSASP